MKILPKNEKEAMKIVYNVLNQGDSRYNDAKEEIFLSFFILHQMISLEEKNIPSVNKPTEKILEKIWGKQKNEKYLAKILLKQKGFKDNEIFFERSFLELRPDVFAEKENMKILVECCSCKVRKILEYLQEINEVWIITRGPWETSSLHVKKTQWFIFKKGPNWNKVLGFKKRQIEELKKVKSPLDTLMKFNIM